MLWRLKSSSHPLMFITTSRFRRTTSRSRLGSPSHLSDQPRIRHISTPLLERPTQELYSIDRKWHASRGTCRFPFHHSFTRPPETDRPGHAEHSRAPEPEGHQPTEGRGAAGVQP